MLGGQRSWPMNKTATIGYLEGNQGKPCPQPPVDIQVLLPSKSDSMGVGP